MNLSPASPIVQNQVILPPPTKKAEQIYICHWPVEYNLLKELATLTNENTPARGKKIWKGYHFILKGSFLAIAFLGRLYEWQSLKILPINNHIQSLAIINNLIFPATGEMQVYLQVYLLVGGFIRTSSRRQKPK